MDPLPHPPHPPAGAPPMMASGNLRLPKFVDEAEMDEEEYLADLSRRMANSFLSQDEMLVRSPESTLSRIWSPTVTSPPSQISPPERDEAWELLTAAAGQVLRMRLAEQQQQQLKFAGRGLLAQPAKPKRSAGTGVYYSPLLAQQQLQVERFYQLRRQQAMKQALAGVREPGGVYPRAGVPPPPPPPLPLLHHQLPTPASRPVFLTGTRRESAGTGVFLPRRPATTPTTATDLRRKPACPSVQPEMRSRQRVLGDFLLDSDAMVPKENQILPQQEFNKYPHPAPVDHDKLRLPEEWIY